MANRKSPSLAEEIEAWKAGPCYACRGTGELHDVDPFSGERVTEACIVCQPYYSGAKS